MTLPKTTEIAMMSLRNPTFWLVNSGVIVVCFLSGPFGTLDALPSGFRLIYWGLIVLTAGLLALWIHALIQAKEWHAVAITLPVSIVFGGLVSGLVLLLSLALLHPIQRYPGHLELVGYSFPTAAVVFFLSTLATRPAPEQKNTMRPALLNRLEKYGAATQVLSVSAQDHYVEVATELGAELCLLRLNDAISELDPIPGFQIHRSHWVAKSAVDTMLTKGAAAQVTLIDGRVLNVSQSRLAEFKRFLKTP